ncbi:MAG: hypothetical protein HY906_06775 [Deltaproteobacteria bacterium]|nr:hypothetical protein [Deltaproteobacteria bacterium]
MIDLKLSLALPHNLPHQGPEDDHLVERLIRARDYIYDANVTCRVAPFTTDAMGPIVDPMGAQMHVADALRLQARTGVRVSGLFNNIYVPPTHENLELFVRGLEPLYEQGLRSITVPHTLWLKFGLIQRRFPDMTIKSTVLRRVRSGQDFWNLAEAGFDYVMIDRLALRDRRVLKQIREAQGVFAERYGKRVVLAALVAERVCRGDCPFWEEHYQHTMTHPDAGSVQEFEAIFETPQSYSCQKFYNPFSSPILPPFRADFAEVAEFFDVAKWNGRVSGVPGLDVSLDFLDDLLHGDSELVPYTASWYPNQLRNCRALPSAKLLDKWRKVTRTCGFQCWGCSLCTELEHAMRADLVERARGPGPWLRGLVRPGPPPAPRGQRPVRRRTRTARGR